MRYTLLLLYIIFIISCREENTKSFLNINKQYKWYENKKNEILKQSNTKFDKICIWRYGCVFVDSFFISNNYKCKIKVYKNKKIYLEKFLDINNIYEYRIKYYPNGNKQTDGILFYGSYYGLYQSWYGNGRLREIGIKYKSDFIGNYKTWTNTGECKIMKGKEYKNEKLPDINMSE